MTEEDLTNWSIEDLRIITSEIFVDEETNEKLYCVYNLSLDAVTFVGETEFQQLLERGIESWESLPDY